MKAEYARSLRINDLYKKALSGRYTWEDLKVLTLKMGVTKATSNSYLAAVEARLNKKGLMKK